MLGLEFRVVSQQFPNRLIKLERHIVASLPNPLVAASSVHQDDWRVKVGVSCDCYEVIKRNYEQVGR